MSIGTDLKFNQSGVNSKIKIILRFISVIILGSFLILYHCYPDKIPTKSNLTLKRAQDW